MSIEARVAFEWQYSLNNSYHDDPYGYRYSLVERFRTRESNVVWVLDNVQDPSDAYIVFRLAELSGRPATYVVDVYRQNRYATWFEISSLLGVNVRSYEFDNLRRSHDLPEYNRHDNRRYDRYEDRRVIIKREEIYVPHVYEQQRERYREVEPRHYEQHHERREYYNDENNRYEYDRRR